MLEVCTTLLQAAAAAGLTLAEIAGVVTRPLIGMEEEPSELERVCFNARAEVEDWSESDDEADMAEGEDEGADSSEGELPGRCWATAAGASAGSAGLGAPACVGPCTRRAAARKQRTPVLIASR